MVFHRTAIVIEALVEVSRDEETVSVEERTFRPGDEGYEEALAWALGEDQP